MHLWLTAIMSGHAAHQPLHFEWNQCHCPNMEQGGKRGVPMRSSELWLISSHRDPLPQGPDRERHKICPILGS